MRAQRYAVAAIGGAVLVVSAAQLAKGQLPKARVFIGGAVAAFILSAMAGPLPGVARGLATIAILGALLTSGYDLARPVIKIIN